MTGARALTRFPAPSLGKLVLSCGMLGGLLSGCGEPDDPTRPQHVVAELSENISTVVNVRWTTDEPTTGYVEYGPTEAMEHSTPLEPDRARGHSVSLLGLTEDTEVYYRVVMSAEDGAGASAVATIRTGRLPVGLPTFTQAGEGHDLFTVVPVLGLTTAVIIINPQGEIVWYHTDDRQLDFFRARLSIDGESLLYNAASVSGDPADNSELVRVSLDGSVTSSIAIPLLAHDFVEHPDGTLAAIVVEYRDFEGTSLRGDKIVEAGEDGELSTVWSAWDCFDPAQVEGESPELGWTFANALDYDPVENAYYVGMRNFSSIAKIDRETGSCEWVLGLAGSTLDFTEGSARFLHQHQFDVVGDHIVVLDNDGSSGSESRVLEYELDLGANVATEVWSYVAEPSVYTFVLGEPTRLSNGDTFITWSAAGQMDRVTAEGESRWTLNSSLGYAFGFHTLARSLYAALPEPP